MRILGTADIHIYDYSSYAIYDEKGVPDRLKQFETLAEDIVSAADAYNADVIVVAGDIIHSPIVRPMVLGTGRKFITTLANSGKIVIITHGQHDLDTKSHTSEALHSVVGSIAPKYDNLHYCSSPRIIEALGKKIFVQPWVEDLSKIEYQDADIFVGHGIVDGAKTYDGYGFLGGFSSQALNSRYRLSIIGDIHKGQTFSAAQSSNKVLIPGAPIQTTFKDDPNCGLWVCTVEPKDINLEFIPIQTIRGDGTYHQFLTVDEGEEFKQGSHIHYRVRKSKKSFEPIPGAPPQPTTPATFTIGSDSIMDITLQEMMLTKPQNPDLVRDVLKEGFEAIRDKQVIKIPAKILTMGVTAKDIFSIKEFSYAFSTAGDLLVIGENGSGKTSIAEILLWGYTGETTKPLSVDRLLNKYTKGDAEVSIFFSVNDTDIWRIHRIRHRQGGGSLMLFSVKDGQEVEFKKSSMKETQELIYQILGMSYTDIMMMCYFSTRKLMTFTGSGDSDKNALTGKLVGVDQVDAYRDSITVIHNSLADTIKKVDGVIEVLQAQVITKDARIKYLTNEETEAKKLIDYTPITDKVTKLQLQFNKDDLVTSLQEYRDLRNNVNNTLDPLADQNVISVDGAINVLHNRQLMLVHSKSSGENQLRILEGQVTKAQEGKCALCDQALQNEDVIKALSIDWNTINDQITENVKALKSVEEAMIIQNQLRTTAQINKNENDLVKQILCDLDALIEAVVNLQSQNPNMNHSEEKRILNEDMTRLAEQAGNEFTERDKLKLRLAVAYMIKQTILSKTGPVVKRFNEIVCKMVADELGAIITDRTMIDVRVNSGKSLNIEMKFRDRPEWSDITEMSGGEDRITNFLVMVALNNLFSKKYNLAEGILGMVIFDETFSFLDAKYMDIAYSALQSCVSTNRIIITHDVRLQSNFHKVMHVNNVAGISEYKELM